LTYLAFQEDLPGLLSDLKCERPVRLFCQDECRIGRMPITRRRVTSPGVKPVPLYTTKLNGAEPRQYGS
jgi:hypothetical protein